MLISSFLHKKIYEHGQYRGVCEGVLLAPKSHVIKGILSKKEDSLSCIPFTHVDYATDTIRLKKYTVIPYQHYEKFRPGLPIYDEKGIYLGRASDLETQKGIAVAILLEDGSALSAALLVSCKDAVIVKKKPPFPLCYPIPATAKTLLEEAYTPTPFVTKRTLRTAAKKGKLIRLTLSILSSNGVFCGKF